MARFILLSILLTILLRSVGRLWQGIVRGMQGDARYVDPSRGNAASPQRSVQMARDPICGTFVVPERAVALITGSERLYFCSTDCRDKYRADPHAGPAPAHGRTA